MSIQSLFRWALRPALVLSPRSQLREHLHVATRTRTSHCGWRGWAWVHSLSLHPLHVGPWQLCPCLFCCCLHINTSSLMRAVDVSVPQARSQLSLLDVAFDQQELPCTMPHPQPHVPVTCQQPKPNDQLTWWCQRRPLCCKREPTGWHHPGARGIRLKPAPVPTAPFTWLLPLPILYPSSPLPRLLDITGTQMSASALLPRHRSHLRLGCIFPSGLLEGVHQVTPRSSRPCACPGSRTYLWC